MRTAKLEAKLFEVIEQMSQHGARDLQRELRARNLAHQQARRQLLARSMAVGKALERAGLVEWTPEQVLGLVLHAHENTAKSPTMRLAFEKRGRAAMHGGRDPPSSQTQEPDESTVSEGNRWGGASCVALLIGSIGTHTCHISTVPRGTLVV